MDPIAESEMNAAIDYSYAERVDGLTDTSSSIGRKRDSHTEPLNLADLDYLVAYAIYGPLWEFAEQIAAELEVKIGPGRPREYEIHSVIMSDVMLYQKLSVRNTFRSLNSPVVWGVLVDQVEKAWPRHETRRLDARPLSRDQFNRGRKILCGGVFCYIDRLRAHCRETQLSIAKLIGCFVNDDSLTHPANHNMIYGDATWLESLYGTEPSSHVDRETGEILTHRVDPDARRSHDDDQFPGNYWVSALIRTAHPHERVILDAEFKPAGIGDAESFTNMVLPIFDVMPETRGVGYDMALHAKDNDRILDTGRHVMVKVQHVVNGKSPIVPLGKLTFKNGSRTTQFVVSAYDGTPGIEMVVDGQRMFQRLERVQTKLRGRTLYGNWRIPAQPSVVTHLQGLTTWIRHSSTADERKNGTRRTRALSTIPQSDPDWKQLFGGREDTESMHNHMKAKWYLRRCPAVGLERRELLLRGHQESQGIEALIAWHYRTNGDVSRYFGEWQPPNRNPKKRC